MFSFGSKKPKPTFDVVKLKANLKMAVGRVRLQQGKRVNSVKRQRKEMAELLNLGKLDACRIRVESAIREDLSIEGLEVLNLFLELVASRMQVIAEAQSCPLDMKESITSVLWASPRVGEVIVELQTVRSQFAIKFGQEFVDVATHNSELSVNSKLMEKLDVGVPTNEMCRAYMESIAAEYGLEVDFSVLDGPAAIIATTADPQLLQPAAFGAEGKVLSVGGNTGFTTTTGVLIPPIIVPYDDLEARLLTLKRN